MTSTGWRSASRQPRTLAPALAHPDLTCSLMGRSRFENPLSPLQPIDRQPDLTICKLLLAFVPGVGGLGDFVGSRDRLVSRQPVHRGQKFKAERCFEPVDQGGDSLKTGLRIGVACKELLGVRHSPGNERDLFAWRLASTRESSHEMTFHRVEYVPQILGVRTVMSLDVLQPEGLSCLLHEVHELVNFKKRDEWIEQTRDVSIHQADEGGPPRRHRRDLLVPQRRRIQWATRLEHRDLDAGQVR